MCNMYAVCYNFYSVKRVQIHGTEYRPCCALRIVEMDEVGFSDNPSYGKVEEIIIWEDEQFFIHTVLRTSEFHQQFMAYEVLTINQKISFAYQFVLEGGIEHHNKECKVLHCGKRVCFS